MTQFATNHGLLDVASWGYRLQGTGGNPLDANAISQTSHDLVVIDFSADGSGANAFSNIQISAIKTAGKVAVSYITIGEASQFRDHWQTNWTTTGIATGPKTASAPTWLGPNNPDWPESCKVRFWEKGWQDIVFNDAKTGWLDKIVGQGFDAAYLDIVDGYYFWGAEVAAADKRAGDPATLQDSARRMVDFIIAMADHARATNPYFFVILQNGEGVLDDAGAISVEKRARFLDAVGAVAVEDVYNPGNLDENNPSNPAEYRVDILKSDYLANNIPVFAVDYLNQPALVSQFNTLAAQDGFVPYTSPTRGLDLMGPEYIGPAVTNAYRTPVGTANADALVGKAPADLLRGLAGDDHFYGGGGSDLLYGDAGSDKVNGGVGNDHLWGGAGADRLTGGAGNDYARYDDANWGNLTIRLDAPSLNTGAAAGDVYAGIEGLVGGLGNDFVIGNAANNYLFGGAGDDNIYGLAGNDYLNGGAGADKFRFVTALNAATNVDRIAGFMHGVDDLVLSKTIFAAIGTTLDAGELRLGTAAADANDYLIYNSANGQLFYDANGNAAGGQTLFAILAPGTVLGTGDFFMA